MTEHILIVEDEIKIATLLKNYLEDSGYYTTHIANGGEVEAWLQESQPALILLDLMLPGKNGMDLCKSIRKNSSVPIIMVTARVEEIDRLLGLEYGADDYICKPFSPREVVARVKTVLRRTQTDPTPSALSLNPEKLQACIGGRELSLTAVEFKLLDILAAQPGRIFSRSQLIDTMYADYRIVSDRTVDSHIKKLRKKIASHIPGQQIIHSVYGVGYKYEPCIDNNAVETPS